MSAGAGPADPARPSRTGWRSAAFVVALVVLVGTGIGLAYAGVRTVRESTAGQRFDPTLDPDQPGYEALVGTTPTMLLLHEGPEGLVGAVLLSSRGDGGGGGVLLVPAGTVVDPFGEARRLDDVFADEGLDGARRDLEAVLGLGASEAKVVDDQRWAELVAPVAPVTVENPDDLGEFSPGEVELGPGEVARWLEIREPGPTDANRLLRQQLFWEAWIGAVGEAESDDAVPGEVDAGLGRFVRDLTDGPSTVAVLPGREEDGDERGARWLPEYDELSGLVATLVPFPTAAEPGGRTRVRLLDGVGDPDLVSDTAPLLVPAGAEIVILGNAGDGFGHEVTTLRVHDPALDAAAERLREALGTGQIVTDLRPTDTYDITIVVGADLPGR